MKKMKSLPGLIGWVMGCVIIITSWCLEKISEIIKSGGRGIKPLMTSVDSKMQEEEFSLMPSKA